MKNIPLYISIALVSLLATPAVSQKKVSHQDMLWVRYYEKFKISEDWAINLELEDRRFAFPDRQQVWILPRLSASRSLGNNWSVGGGFVYYINNSPADPKAATELSVPELRPYEELTYKQKIGELAINHRYWIEERFIRKNDGKALQAGYRFNFRIRYRLQLQYPLVRSEKLKLVAGDEIMLNFGHSIVRNTFDQNRLFAGLNYTLSKYAQFEADYINQFQEKSSGEDYLACDILRITFYHTIAFH